MLKKYKNIFQTLDNRDLSDRDKFKPSLLSIIEIIIFFVYDTRKIFL